MKTRRAKTILSIVLTLALALGLMTTAYAAPEEEPAGETQSEEAATGIAEETEYTVGAEDTEDTEDTENTVDTELTEDAEPETGTADSDTDSDAGIRLFAAEPEELSEETGEEDPEDADPEIQVFAATEGEQDLIVKQEEKGTIGEDVSFPYHIYQITEAEETITNMSDITASEAGADLAYVICDADGKEISSGTMDAKGSFALTVGQSAQFTLEAGTSWYVYQDAPEAYPLLSVESDGDYAGVVDSTNGVVYYGQIEPETYTATVILTLYDYNENVLPGATFALYRNDELYASDLVTDENGQITVTDLEPGEYYFEEISVEESGYELPGYHYSRHFVVEETLTEDVTITREMHNPATQTYNVKYAVCVYGIQQDVDENGETLGLTFGPATGASYINTYKAHVDYDEFNDPQEEHFCIHWMSWEEIIEQCAEDPTVFEDCLESGCTHAVDLMVNSTLLATDNTGQMDDGDGAGYLYNSINSNYRMWNSSDYNTGGWPASQVRAVFNGKDDQTGSYATYALDASVCLFSCFPSVLQDAIAAKAVKSDTVYNSQTEADNKTTYDKLWLFSGKELYADSGSNNDAIRTYEGELYQRSTALGITTSNYGGLKNYNETGGNSYWWLRSPLTSHNGYVYYVYASGDWYNTNARSTYNGLAPGFCLK